MNKINAIEFPRNCIEYLFVIILVLDGNTIWTSYENGQINRVLKLALVLIVALYILINGGVLRKNLIRIILFGFFLMIYFSIYWIAVGYGMRGFLYFLIDVFCIFSFAVVAQERQRGVSVLCKYVNIIIILAVVSLLFWVFGSILGIIHSTGTVYSTWTGNDELKKVPTYYNLYFETQTLGGITRNTGIFTEAPMYNLHLCIALMVQLFVAKRISKWKCLILVVTILTTVSTTGWILMIVALLARYIVERQITKFSMILKVILIPSLLVIGIIAIQILATSRLGSSSGSIRLDDFVAGFQAWKTEPLFGAGFRNADYVKQFMSSFRSENQGFSNSPMQILYQGGVFFLVPYVYFIVQGFYQNVKKRNIKWVLFCGCFLYLFILTVIPYKFLTIFILMICALDENNAILHSIRGPCSCSNYTIRQGDKKFSSM